LKVSKLGMDSKSVIARFEEERQALDIMENPCPVWPRGGSIR
jgi:hypothetical protein